jgi:hypothetical protein
MPTNLRVTTLGEIRDALDDFRHDVLSQRRRQTRTREIKYYLSEWKPNNNQDDDVVPSQRLYGRVSKCNSEPTTS